MSGDIQSATPQPIAFGKYTLLERISHGGMAEVFRAKTQGTAGFERVVAIKLLLPQVANDADFVTMLIDEAKIAGQLSHANIAQIFDLGQVDGRYFIVQEYVPGRDLRAIFHHLEDRHGRLSPAQSSHVMLKICEALDYAHNKRDSSGQPLNLVHRDISPQNIIVSHEGEVKLIDFGIVKAEGRQTRTLAGLVKGKFAYMSPEQIRGLPVDRRSDVFACGIILHELLTGQSLFKRGSEFETLQRARAGEIPPPSQLNPAVPADLDRVALRALARHVDDRYQSAVAMRDDLWDVVRAHQLYHSRDQLGSWMLETFGGPGVSDLEPASSVDLGAIGATVAPSRTGPRPQGRSLDDDEDHENMTVVDPELQSRLRSAIEDGDGDTVAAILGSGLAPPAGPRGPAGPTVRDLANAAHADPDRAVFRSGPADSVLDLVASELSELPGGDDEATRAHPNLREMVAAAMAAAGSGDGPSSSSASDPTIVAGGWAEPQTPTRRRAPLDARDQDGDDRDDPIARLAARLPPPERVSGAPAGRGRDPNVNENASTTPYLPFDAARALAEHAARGQRAGSPGPVQVSGPEQRTIGPAQELRAPAGYPAPTYPQVSYPTAGNPGSGLAITPHGPMDPRAPHQGAGPHGPSQPQSFPPGHGPGHGPPPPGGYPPSMSSPAFPAHLAHGPHPGHPQGPPDMPPGMHGQMHPGQHPGPMHPGQMHPGQMHPGQMQPGPGWQLGPRPGAPGPGITRLWLVVAVAVLVAALVISIVLAVTSG